MRYILLYISHHQFYFYLTKQLLGDEASQVLSSALETLEIHPHRPKADQKEYLSSPQTKQHANHA